MEIRPKGPESTKTFTNTTNTRPTFVTTYFSAQKYIFLWNSRVKKIRAKSTGFGEADACRAAATGEDGPQLSTEQLAARAFQLFYINDYIPIYTFTHTHTYLTFFPFLVVYSPYVLPGRVSACVRASRTERTPLSYLRVFRKSKAFYLSFLLFRSVVEQCLGCCASEYFLSIYVFHFTCYIFWAGMFW